MKSRADGRPQKRRINQWDAAMRKANKHGKNVYYEDCGFHICKLTIFEVYKKDRYGTSVDGESLFKEGMQRSCSLFHCAPVILSEKEALERVDYYKKYGETKYMVDRVGVDPVEWDKFTKVWKNECLEK